MIPSSRRPVDAPSAQARGFDVADDACGPDTDGFHKNSPPNMLLYFPEPHDEALGCMLKLFDECGAKLECSDALARDPRPSLEKCFDQHDSANALDGAVDWLSCDGVAAKNMHLNDGTEMPPKAVAV